MANQNEYYPYSKLAKFRGYERKFRTIQSLLLIVMVISFIFYMITFGLDFAKFLNDPAYLAAALTIVCVAMVFLIIGIRGVALESFCMVLTFAIVFLFVAIAHGVSFLFRHPALTAVNLALAILMLLGAIIYLYYLCRMNRLKPPDYGVNSNNAEALSEDTESSVALTSEQQKKQDIADYDSKRGFGGGDVEKIIVGVKSGFSDLNRGLGKQDLGNIRSGSNDEPEQVKRELEKLGAGVGEKVEKEFVAVKRVLLNEAQKGLGGLKTGMEQEYGQMKSNLTSTQRELSDNVKREFTVVKRDLSTNMDRMAGNVQQRFGDLEKELGGSFKSGLSDIEKEFNIFQKEFGGSSGDGGVQKVISSVRKGFEEFKSVGGENVKREIVEVKRDEDGNITSYIERRLTDSGVEISSVSVDKGRAPMANFTNT